MLKSYGLIEPRGHCETLQARGTKESNVTVQSPMELRIHGTVRDPMEPKVHCDTAGPHGILEAMVTL